MDGDQVFSVVVDGLRHQAHFRIENDALRVGTPVGTKTVPLRARFHVEELAQVVAAGMLKGQSHDLEK